MMSASAAKADGSRPPLPTRPATGASKKGGGGGNRKRAGRTTRPARVVSTRVRSTAAARAIVEAVEQQARQQQQQQRPETGANGAADNGAASNGNGAGGGVDTRLFAAYQQPGFAQPPGAAWGASVAPKDRGDRYALPAFVYTKVDGAADDPARLLQPDREFHVSHGFTRSFNGLRFRDSSMRAASRPSCF